MKMTNEQKQALNRFFSEYEVTREQWDRNVGIDNEVWVENHPTPHWKFEDVYKSNKVMYTGLHPSIYAQECIDGYLDRGLTKQQILDKFLETFENVVKHRTKS
jgi:hypothetical protein